MQLDKVKISRRTIGPVSIFCFLAIVISLTFIALRMRNSNIEKKSVDEQIETEAIRDGVVDDDGEKKLYINGEIQTNTWSEDEHGNIYYTGVNGRISTGRTVIGGITYYFNDDGTLYTGWKLAANHWYYFTRDGAVTGYQTINDEYGNAHDYYFDEHGYLVTNTETPDGRVADEDGYLNEADVDTSNAETLDGFEYSVSDDIAPGKLSGIYISGEPAEFYMLSIAGETSGGQIIMGDRGRAYGLCQFDYRYDLAAFMRWACSIHPELWSGFDQYLSYNAGAEELVGNQGIANVFTAARQINYEAAISDELLFMRQLYWDSFQTVLDNAGFSLSTRHVAVSAAMFSVNVNCGMQSDAFISNLSPEMTDVELICGTYKLRNTVLAEQAVGRYGRKGTTGRYLSAEPQMALDLYHGYTTIDTAKNYGYGVQWLKNIFTEAVTTIAIDGSSSEWDDTLSESESIASETPPDDLADLDLTNDLADEDATDSDEAVCQEEVESGPGMAITESSLVAIENE